MVIELTLNKVKLLATKEFGYYNSGVYPKTISYFYSAEDNAQKLYTISTTHKLSEGDKIKASVKGESIFRGKKQINLNRVHIMEKAPDVFKGISYNKDPITIFGIN